jgi:hypothetical protein
MEKPSQKILNFYYEAMVHSIEFLVNYTNFLRNFNIRKINEKYVLNRLGFKYFYIKNLIDYDFNMKKIKTN